jgi:hypothetical protein
MNIGIYTGYWSTNIGNSFFQLGAEFVLRKVFPTANIFPIADEPGYIFPKKGNPANAFNPTQHMEMDYAVILGPFIRPEISSIVLPTLRVLKSKRVKIIAMGVGMMDYKKSTVDASIAILKEINPDLFISRDAETYEAFKNHTIKPYNGIDLGFFSNDIYNGPGVSGKYVALNFDQLPEPIIDEKLDDSDQFQFLLNQEKFSLNFNLNKKSRYEKGLKNQLLDRILFKQPFNEKIGEYEVIRTDHRYNPVILKKIYSLPNTFSSDIPQPYWAIYKNAQMTISNRVHACVATLSFGNPAWLFTKSPRAFLLDRVGVKDIKNGPVQLNQNRILEEKEKLSNFLKSALW